MHPTSAQQMMSQGQLPGHGSALQALHSIVTQWRSSQRANDTAEPVINASMQDLLNCNANHKQDNCRYGFSLGNDGRDARGRFRSAMKAVMGKIRAALHSK
jgi:hypothetical protein